MEVFDALRTLLAVRQYQDRPVPEVTVQRIVEAGRLTGSAMNAQPWHFIVIQERDTRRQLGRLARSGPYVAQAALAIVVVVEKKSRFAVSRRKPHHPLDDAGGVGRRRGFQLGWP